MGRQNWAYILDHQFVPLLKMPKPCGDCAVECGFYEDHAKKLRAEIQSVQAEVSQRRIKG